MPIVALEGMEFFAHHGVYPSEKERGNTFVADVWLDLGEAPLPDSDELSEALDYSAVYEVVSSAMSDRANLLETLVGRIGRGLKLRVPGWKSARVRVSKLSPPLDGPVVRSYVEETFRRG
jgi:dihydroneopterin aldolase